MSVKSNQTVITSVAAGIKLLPFFIHSIETLFGRHTGQEKKDAAKELFDAAALGAAVGFGLSGDQSTSDLINVFRPAVDQTIDAVAAQLFPSGSTAIAAPAVNTGVALNPANNPNSGTAPTGGFQSGD